MELELSSSICKGLVTSLKYLASGGYSSVVVQMRSRHLALSCVSASLATAYLFTIPSNHCIAYRFSNEKRPGCRLTLSRFIDALKSSTLEFTSDVLLSFTAASLIFTSKPPSSPTLAASPIPKFNPTLAINVLCKLFFEETPFLRAAHDSLNSFPIRLQILAETLKAHLRCLGISSGAGGCTLQVDVHCKFGCLLQTLHGTRSARLLVDPSDWLPSSMINAPASLILSGSDLWTMCQMALVVGAPLSIYLSDSDNPSPVVFQVNSLDQSLEIKCVLSPIQGKSSHSHDNDNGNGNDGDDGNKSIQNASREFAPDSLLDELSDDQWEIPATPEY